MTLVTFLRNFKFYRDWVESILHQDYKQSLAETRAEYKIDVERLAAKHAEERTILERRAESRIATVKEEAVRFVDSIKREAERAIFEANAEKERSYILQERYKNAESRFIGYYEDLRKIHYEVHKMHIQAQDQVRTIARFSETMERFEKDVSLQQDRLDNFRRGIEECLTPA